ncbi:uncharacterized protein LOC131293373 [Anopheles ziemanni]|uniref:uncharacterized protein LOC131264197 n=1 Tax=Anopheles coustani TaxID=139045 RepID=UPI00265A87DF|nr:uncharacterized protein LOC131264197 [Anopheles coustani]XP_058177434.1 uncharacterized protein LOC131293373 [Anopheles ziemanni]
MKTNRAAILLAMCAILATCLAAEGMPRSRRDLRYRPNVAYAYQYRTEQIAPVPRIPIVPVASAHIQSQLLRQVKPERPVPHFPTRRPMQAVDRLHTRVDIGHQQHQKQHQHPTVHPSAAAHTPGTIVAHSHTEVYRKYR